MPKWVAEDKTVQKWGNGLAVRISSKMASAAHIEEGSRVKLEVVENGVLVSLTGKPRVTLDQMLASYDPVKHGGECLDDGGSVGAERF